MNVTSAQQASPFAVETGFHVRYRPGPGQVPRYRADEGKRGLLMSIFMVAW
jgi:hypothetical protein